MSPRRSHRSPQRCLPSLAGALAAWALAASLVAAPAKATLSGAEVTPLNPTTCDSLTLTVSGSLPDPCYHVLGMRVSDPEPLPTAGPIPSYKITAVVTTEEPNPLIDVVCPTVIQPYKLSASLGVLPFGQYLVDAVEYLHPYPAGTTAPKDSSRVHSSFFVTIDSCGVVGDCVLLGFARIDVPQRDGCTVETLPGNRACFDVTLMNLEDVGALQTDIVVDPTLIRAGADWFTPVGVTVSPRAAGFQAAWVAEGSRAKIVLYSTSGATIPPGRGPVLRVCYDVAAGTIAHAYPIRFENSLVSSPAGMEIPFCPTFVAVEGRLCVGAPPAACDLDGSGTSDVLDIVRLVGCVLGSPPEVCPDSVRALADCNGDGLVDVRDVVCCVRKILSQGSGWGPGSSPPTEPGVSPTSLGFDGAARWLSPFEGAVDVAVQPGTSFGGIQWVIRAGSAARIRDVTIDDPNGAYALDWEARDDGTVRVMLFDRGLAEAGSSAAGRAPAGAAPLQIHVALEPGSGAGSAGQLTIESWRASTRDAAMGTVSPGAVSATVPANAAAGVPAVLPARPNPFLTDTEIAFSLPSAGRASLRLYDVKGRLVRTLVSGPVDGGVHRLRWDGRDARGRLVGAGVYFVRLESAGVTRTLRLLRLR